MIAGLLQMAAFLGTAWLLSVAVDSCYRRNEAADGAPPGGGPPPRPVTAPPARAPLPAVPGSGLPPRTDPVRAHVGMVGRRRGTAPLVGAPPH